MSHHPPNSLVLSTHAFLSSCALLYPTFLFENFKTRENICQDNRYLKINRTILDIQLLEKFFLKNFFEKYFLEFFEKYFFSEWQKFLSVICPTMPREVTLKISSENMVDLEKLL